MTIAKADVSDQVVFSSQDSFVCDGSPVVFAPDCAGIDEWSFTYYENNVQLDAAPSAPGSYTVEISGEGVNCFAKLTHAYSIVPAEIEYTATGYSGMCDGEAHSITVNVITEGATVSYATSADGEFAETNPVYT